jgi:Ca2+-binding RTX toxin-like protein
MKTLTLTGATGTNLQITLNHFGANILEPLNTDNGQIKPLFLEAINELDITDLRYPAGEPDLLYQNGLIVDGRLPEHLVNFMESVVDRGTSAIIVTPSFGSYTGPAELQRFAELLLEDYGPQVAAFEIGNEYWQQQGETAYGMIANQSVLALAAARQATGEGPAIWVQMGNASAKESEFYDHPVLGWEDSTIEANRTIIRQLSDTALDEIDGIVEHGYYKNDLKEFGSLKETTTMIWLDVETWERETDREFDLAITEWNIKATNENQHGMKSASGLLNHFEHLIELGADYLEFWAPQHNTMTDLAGTTGITLDPATGYVDYNVGGAIFDMMSSNLVGKELLNLEISGVSQSINMHGYASDREVIIYISSRSDQVELIEFSLGDVFGAARLEEAILLGYDPSPESSDGVRFSAAAEGFVAADYLIVEGQRYYVNEHDARAKIENLPVIDQIPQTYELKPYQVLQLTFDRTEHDSFSATHGADRLIFGAGNQSVQLLNGDDTIDTGQDEDIIYGGGGNDHIISGAGDDFVSGGTGDDFVSAWGGNDTVFGDVGADTIYGFQGADNINGGSGNDSLRGDDQNDTVFGDGGFDTIEGGNGDDSLFGGANADQISGGNGNDYLSGGEGFDRLFGEVGDDRLDGGGNDDALFGGSGNDFISDSLGSNRAFGGPGFDTITGGRGNDTLFGEGQADMLIGGAGDDQIFGGQGFDMLYGGNGDDLLNGGIHNDRVVGGEGDDTLFGEAGFDFLEGEDGNDLLYGGNEADRMTGGFGHDLLVGGSGVDYLFGGNQDDTLDGGMGSDTLIGGNGEDIISGGDADDHIIGGTGNDLVVGGSGNDTIYAGSGFDSIYGSDGNDILFGNFNADIFFFDINHGHDTIRDFEVGNKNEKIDLQGVRGIGQFSDILDALQQNGNNVVLTTGSDSSITFQNADISQMYDFQFII